MEPITPVPGVAVRQNFTSLVDLIRYQAETRPEHAALVFLADGETETGRLSYAGLERCARIFAAHLQAKGLSGQAVLLMLPSGMHYVVAFLGSLYAGAIPVPAYPPANSIHTERLAQIVKDCDAKGVVFSNASRHDDIRTRLTEFLPQGIQCGFLPVEELLEKQELEWREPVLTHDTLAYLQYTSGSTSQPRGVMVTHGNLLEHCRHLQQGLQQDHDDVYVTWLPLFHDLGLIAGILQPLYLGATSVLMPSMAFLQRPVRWLDAISRYRGTSASAPNFAYELCATTLDEEQRKGLDLSSWSIALNGAEPVRASTIQKFCESFASCGFRPEAMNPAYGLAEATLTVSYGARLTAPSMCEVDADALEHKQFLPASGQGKTRVLVGSGRSWLDIRTAIVDPDTGRVCGEGEIGEIWVHGLTVADGYWQRPEQSAMTFRARLPDGDGPFLRTGDLGALHQGMLYVTGRIKDLIIIRGRNHYPQDIEQTVCPAHAALEDGHGAAFSIEAEGDERLVIVQEIRRAWRKRFDGDEVVQAIRSLVAEQHGVSVHAVLLLKPASVHITSSGKIQRQACRKDYLENRFEALYSWSETMAGMVPDRPQAADPEGGTSSGSLTSPARESENLGAMSPEQIKAWVQAYLLESACAVLRIGADRQAELEPSFLEIRLNQLGMDSLTAIELCGKTLRELGVDVPVHYFLGSATAGEAVDLIRTQLMLKNLVANADDASPDDDEMEACIL